MQTPPTTFEIPTTDALTQLLSAQYFRHLLREKVLPTAEQQYGTFTLFLLDVDGFADYNTAYGREAGDTALTDLSAILRDTLPSDALLVRYGGDEFGGILPEMRIDDAFTLLEEVRRKVMAHFGSVPAPTLTSSVGLASYPTHGKHEAELMREADHALYWAKSTGRNKVALPITDSRMITKTSYYTATQLEKLSTLAKTLKRNEASILREALDDVFKKYGDLRERVE